MKNREKHDFEYFEEQAAYFKYTHEKNWDNECEVDYLKLYPEVIEKIQKKAVEDIACGKPKIGLRELEEYILDEGLIKYGDTAEVIDDLYCSYEYFFIADEYRREHEKKSILCEVENIDDDRVKSKVGTYNLE